MNPAPQLHPAHLLKNVTDTITPTPDVRATLAHHLICDGATVEIFLSKEGALQLQFTSPAAVNELRDALKRVLNVWDIGAPRWIWQLDAMLDPTAREITKVEGVRLNLRG